MGSASQGLPGCWVSSGSVRDFDVRSVVLLSLVFYKICTNIIHKVYLGLRSRVSVHGAQRTSP